MMDVERRHEAFYALLDTFNPAQRRAVEQTEGPVLVLAGPGTGKTQMLAARVGKILLDTDAQPQNILCLTFTDAGVQAMRRRLLGMIGPEAYRVPIYTFHAFCNRIIQENREYFGGADLEPVTDLERIELIRQLLDYLSPDHALRNGRKDPYFYERRLRDFFQHMKKEGWTPGLIHQHATHFLQDLPQNPEYLYQRTSKYGQKGEIKQAKAQAAAEKMEVLRAAADLYPKYLNAMTRAGRYEYEDMLLWVLQAFDRHEALLRDYQERFLYFLVDEYQDTNGAQNQLLQRLLDYWETPNVFIVGDDDQSIYEFQGARLKNLLDFYKTYREGLETVVLEQNYRSIQAILDTAQAVIQENALRAIHALDEPLTKQLVAVAPPDGAVQLVVYENRLHEEAAVVEKIEALLQAGEPAAEIAVLYARHQQAARFTALLERRGVAYQTKRPVDILTLPPVQHFRELLRYLHDEINRPFSGEHRLFRLLHAPFWGLDTLALAKAAIAIRRQEGMTWREFITTEGILTAEKHGGTQRNTELHGGTQNSKPKTQNPKLESWISAAADLPLPTLMERLYRETGLLTWALEQPDKVWWLQALNTLLTFAQAEALRHFNPNLRGKNAAGSGLARLLDLLDRMDDNRLRLEMQQSVRPASGIQLLTAHSAKGLEFKYVFMLDCTAEAWEPGNRGGGGLMLPDTLTLSGEEDALEARRRLFYVAMTRAKTHLTLSYSRHAPDGKPRLPARFVAESGLPPEEGAVSAETLIEAQTLLLTEAAAPVITLPEEGLQDELLAGLTLSVTSLNRFLRCPLAFYYQDVLRLPESSSEAAAFGQAMHGALQQFFLHMKADKQQRFPTAEGLLKLFETEMGGQRGFFSIQSYNQRLALGKNFLTRYHAEQTPNWRRRAVVERRIERVEMDGVPLTGVLDKIEWLDDGTLRVVDYKTGAPDPAKTAPPSEAQPHGGDYWRQLIFYKILLDEARQFTETVSHGAISWLEPDKKGSFPVHEIAFDAADLRTVRTLIRDVYTRIQARDFTTGCGEEHCPWCRMHRERELVIVSENMEEGLDDGR